MEKYQVGVMLLHKESGVRGVVIPNFKLPGDVCVQWDTGLKTSYDPDNLDENCIVIGTESTNTDI